MQGFELKDAVPILALFVSLAAVIVGPIVTFKVAKRQIVSPIRQKWIDELRELMSEFLVECEKLVILGEGGGILNKENVNEQLFKRMLYLEQKLTLMLNPEEQDHKDLRMIVSRITDEVNHGVINFPEFGGKAYEATTISQKILKQEWQRVKSGDI